MKAALMHDKGLPEYATILAFDVRADAEATALSEESNVKVFFADIIYHLFDQFSKYMEGIRATRRQAALSVAVFPCILKIMPNNVFNKKDPIILGVEVLEGIIMCMFVFRI
jgi:translation initiation factor 5B